ncbi:MAG TPA: CmpA/NrtA family ABC transporter substrate-binding protein [Burkholderiaceae bacterium]
MTEQESSSDFAKPELERLRLGFMPLTDCAPLVVAETLGLGKKYGLAIELQRQASWAAVRDKLLSGELDAAHALYGLVYGVQLGLGGPQADMTVLMTLNRNGQAISLSNRLADMLDQGMPLGQVAAALGRKPVFAQTFPTGTHAMWLNYWLAAQGIDPLRDVESVVLPPPQMAGAMAHGEIDGFCAGEPWHTVVKANGAGRIKIASGAIWRDHPEKALACRRDFASLYPNTALALIRTLLDACCWLENRDNRREAAGWLAASRYLNLMPDLILPSMSGDSTTPVRFFGQDGMNAPRPEDGLWFLSQYRRWGMLKRDPEWHRVVEDVSATALFNAAAACFGFDAGAKMPVRLIDGVLWNSLDAPAYADAFEIGESGAPQQPSR